MSVTKRGHDSWLIRIYMGREAGKPKYYSETFHARVKIPAQERERELKKKLCVAKQGPHSSIMNLGQYMMEWLQDSKDRLAPRSYKLYEYYHRCLYPLLGHLQLWTLSGEQLREQLRGQFGDLEPRTRQNLYTYVSTVVNAAIGDKKAPMDALVGFRIPRAPKKHPRVLKREELREIRRVALSYRYGLVFVLLVETGARAGEILGLTWEYCDLETGTISIERDMDILTKELQDRPKTENSRRSLKLPVETAELLREHYNKQQQELRQLKVAPLKLDHGLVFLTKNGRPVAYKTIQKTWGYILKRCGLPDMKIHNLRHSVITMLLEEGSAPINVAALVGHDVNTTNREYAHKVKNIRAISYIEQG